MTDTQQIFISHVFDSDKSKSKGIIADKNSSQVCYTDGSKSEIIIVDESYTEESESEIVHKSISINKEKDVIDKTEDEEPLVTDNLVIN